MTDKTKAFLTQEVTRFDIKESTKRHYNHYALGIYLQRIQELPDGLTIAEAIEAAGFQDRLRLSIEKAAGL